VATRSRSALARRLEKSVGPLATATTARMDRELAWYRELSAEDRSWIGLIAQNGIASFTTWFRDPQPVGTLAATVFGHAPRALTRVISLHQTVELVRTTIDAVEEDVDRLLGADDGAVVRDAMLRYSRDIAFAAAEVYARAAEVRGAWDARLEALAVDAVLRGEADEAVRSRASALGWHASHGICVVLGRTPEGVDGEVDSGHTPDAYGAVDELRRSARQAGADTLCAVQGDRLVVVLGGVEDIDKAGVSIADHFGPGPVVMGPLVSDLLVAARSARAAAAGLRAAAGWPGAPRPVAADDLLPERALSGDGHARHQLVTAVYAPVASDGILLDTLEAYLEHGASIEGSARSLFVHANTIRYRLRRIEEVSGLSPAHPRDAYTLRVALTLGRLRGPEAG
jgi:hypothetical protein